MKAKQTGCTGQTGYTVHILDEIIDKSVRQIFSKMRGIPKEQIITRRYEREVLERKNHLQTIQVERDKAQKDLISLKAEILACIKGESVLPKENLGGCIGTACKSLKTVQAKQCSPQKPASAKRKAPYFLRSTVLFWWRIAGSNR